MNKKKLDCSENIHLIRYPEDARPKRVTIQQLPPPEEKISKTTTETSIGKETELEAVPKIDFSVPTLNSILCVEKRMKQVEQKKPRRVKSVSELTQSDRLTFDEKITKQVNFPFDKKLYKELISLKLVDKPISQFSPTTYEPILRDKVPRLEDFFVPTSNYEYSISVSSTLGNHTTTKSYDGLRLQKVMKTWSDDRPD